MEHILRTLTFHHLDQKKLMVVLKFYSTANTNQNEKYLIKIKKPLENYFLNKIENNNTKERYETSNWGDCNIKPTQPNSFHQTGIFHR